MKYTNGRDYDEQRIPWWRALIVWYPCRAALLLALGLQGTTSPLSWVVLIGGWGFVGWLENRTSL